MRLPTGDGMALVFRSTPEEPVRCALEISQAFKKHSELQVRMGIHSGPVNEVADVNERANIAGAGINIAQRVMDSEMPGTSCFQSTSPKTYSTIRNGAPTCMMSANAR